VPVSKPTQYVTRAATVLNISGELQSQALKLIGKLSRFYIAGKDPRSVAAAALYIVCAANKAIVPKWKYARGGLTQVKIARELGVTEVTIRNRYKEILSEMRKSNDPEVQRYLVLLEEA
jgi:transcription initiation factor TFIIB